MYRLQPRHTGIPMGTPLGSLHSALHHRMPIFLTLHFSISLFYLTGGGVGPAG